MQITLSKGRRAMGHRNKVPHAFSVSSRKLYPCSICNSRASKEATCPAVCNIFTQLKTEDISTASRKAVSFAKQKWLEDHSVELQGLKWKGRYGAKGRRAVHLKAGTQCGQVQGQPLPAAGFQACVLLPATKGALFERGRSGADGHNAGVPPRRRSLYWAGRPRALSAVWELTSWHPFLPRLGGCTPTALFPGWCWLSTNRQPASQAPVSSKIHSRVPVTLQSPCGRGGADRLKLVAPSYNVCPALGPSSHSPSWKHNPHPPHTTGKSSMTWALFPGNRTSGQVLRRWKQNTISAGQSTRTQLGSDERTCTTLPFEAPSRKDFFLVSKITITTSDYTRIREDGEATAFSLQDASPGPSWACFSIRDLGLCDSTWFQPWPKNPVPWVITYKDAVGLKPGQSSSAWGFCPGTMLGGGNQLLGAQVIGTLLISQWPPWHPTNKRWSKPRV